MIPIGTDARAAPIGELAWQARWVAGEFGSQFQTEDGRRVNVLHPGSWNREAGPDFRAARVAFDAGDAREGDVELDMRDTDWEAHGHGSNPAFENVRLHVFLERARRVGFARTAAQRAVPQVCLGDHLPRGGQIPPGARRVTSMLPERELVRLVEAAAAVRLRRKAGQLRSAIAVHGFDEACYQALAAAFGYKHNAIPFRALAQRVPLRAAREADGGAMLFGIAGFLSGERFCDYAPDTQRLARRLWARWWAHRARCQRLVLPASAWTFGGVRRANHPHRRLAALRLVSLKWKEFRRTVCVEDPRALIDFLMQLDHPYWRMHGRLDDPPMPRPTALIGRSRAIDVVANLFFPLQVVRGTFDASRYAGVRAAGSSTPVREAIRGWVGEGIPPARFLRSLALQQGLIELRTRGAWRQPACDSLLPGSRGFNLMA